MANIKSVMERSIEVKEESMSLINEYKECVQQWAKYFPEYAVKCTEALLEDLSDDDMVKSCYSINENEIFYRLYNGNFKLAKYPKPVTNWVNMIYNSYSNLSNLYHFDLQQLYKKYEFEHQCLFLNNQRVLTDTCGMMLKRLNLTTCIFNYTSESGFTLTLGFPR
jgi:hypothetical protein